MACAYNGPCQAQFISTTTGEVLLSCEVLEVDMKIDIPSKKKKDEKHEVLGKYFMDRKRPAIAESLGMAAVLGDLYRDVDGGKI